MREFNYNFLKDRQWDYDMFCLAAQIHEYKGRQDLYIDEKRGVFKRLNEIAVIKSSEASNRMEGITTSKNRVKQLCMGKTLPKNWMEEEIIGYRDVMRTIQEDYEHIPIRSFYLLQLHWDMYQHSKVKRGGRYKKAQNVITEIRRDGEVIAGMMPLPPSETAEAMDKICECMNEIIIGNDIDPLLAIPIFINDFLCIYPFDEGNGKLSRLLLTLLLCKSGYLVGKYISIEERIEKTKGNYYEALDKSRKGWSEGNNDPTPLIKYMLGVVLEAYQELESRINLEKKKMSAKEMVELAVKKQEGKFNKGDIMQNVPSIKRASVENALKALVEEGVIERYGKGRATYYVKIASLSTDHL